ncbi:MAG: PP2C family protein-serine/threonine phosphatase [Bacteroidota bacterium]|jgi:serine/threonine protein phosphatase PrpC|nr:protein phosphatase 2C domain-containing protein [Algoriphagus sp.]
MIKILEQEFISEVGQRANNEDKCGYLPNVTYVVCDGVGGSEKGEIASDIVCRSILNTFKEDKNSSIEKALPIAESKMAAYIGENPQSSGMATTLTLAHIREDGVYVAWVGDSRIYQFRAGKIHFVTKDHSWVNDALDLGIITPEEAINHPKSNMITRAVQGTSKPMKADSKLLKDIQANDYFLLCSDGVLESWKDDELEQLFSSGSSCAQVLDQLKLKCEKQSKDNFTAIAFKIKEASLLAAIDSEPQVVEAIPVHDFAESRSFPYPHPESEKENIPGNIKKIALISLAILVLVVGFFLLKDPIKRALEGDGKSKPKQERENPAGDKEPEDSKTQGDKEENSESQDAQEEVNQEEGSAPNKTEEKPEKEDAGKNPKKPPGSDNMP